MSAHRYWRVDLTNSYYVAIAEIEMHTSVGGSDVCTGGAAGSSGAYGGNVAANAFDNSTSTIFETATGTGPFYVSYDFGSGNDKDIIEFSVTSQPTYPSEHPQTVGLSYSDNGSTWTVAMAAKIAEPWSSTQFTMTHQVSGADVKSYWRINASTSQGANYCEIYELELRASIGGADQTVSGGPSRGDSVFGAGYAALAFDGNTATGWQSDSGFPHYLYYRFPADIDIAEYVITAGPSAGSHNTYAPKTWTLEYSGDGTTWTTADTQSVANWSSGETRTYTVGGGGGSGSARPACFVCT